MGCEICIDIATEAMQMHNAGASVAAIRAAIDEAVTAPRPVAHADADAAGEGSGTSQH